MAATCLLFAGWAVSIVYSFGCTWSKLGRIDVICGTLSVEWWEPAPATTCGCYTYPDSSLGGAHVDWWRWYLFYTPGYLTVQMPAWVLAVACAAPLVVARTVTKRWRRASGRCLSCGYSLRGLTARRCPECGRAF